MGPPSRAHGPSAGPAEANGLPEAYGARGHCPPLSAPLFITTRYRYLFSVNTMPKI